MIEIQSWVAVFVYWLMAEFHNEAYIYTTEWRVIVADVVAWLSEMVENGLITQSTQREELFRLYRIFLDAQMDFGGA
jgi:hypothetical protein